MELITHFLRILRNAFSFDASSGVLSMFIDALGNEVVVEVDLIELAEEPTPSPESLDDIAVVASTKIH